MLGQASASSLVLTLLEGCRPSAIVGSIGTVIVDTLDRQSRRRFAHILNKGLETITPALANRDAAAAVVLKSLVVRIETSLLHRRPAFEGARAAASMRASESAKLFSMEAFAANDLSADESVPANDLFGSAVAAAKPASPSVFIHVREADHGQPPEALTSDVSKLWHILFNGEISPAWQGRQ